MNIKQQDVSFWSQKADSFMQQKAQGKNTLSVQDVASLFMKEGRYIDAQVIENIAGEDKQVDKNELAMLLYMLDGTKKYDANDKSQYWVEHDWFIQSNVYKHNGVRCGDEIDDSLKDTLANTATPEEFAEIQKAFGIQGKPQFGLNGEPPKTSDTTDKKIGIMSTITDEEYQAKLDKIVDKILNGKESIKLGEFKKTALFSAIQNQFETKMGRSNFYDIATMDTALDAENVQDYKSLDDIEISRNELKTLFMAADADLVNVNGEEKFVFNSVAIKQDNSGLTEMTKDELKQIYMIMSMRSEYGAEMANSMVEHIANGEPVEIIEK